MPRAKAVLSPTRAVLPRAKAVLPTTQRVLTAPQHTKQPCQPPPNFKEPCALECQQGCPYPQQCHKTKHKEARACDQRPSPRQHRQQEAHSPLSASQRPAPLTPASGCSHASGKGSPRTAASWISRSYS
ncbi:putative small proline-rich protein 5 [Hippopotamus amphibius kiboko]|uniref:putative small proline-rich protein 5 n=1 Tax=Hippopotamus amphibius kiboko TaxID=575201 RepID=UPI00259250C7|nr:putative small proline-rich protein 5 [Hippopotamus amphibius kiboko]